MQISQGISSSAPFSNSAVGSSTLEKSVGAPSTAAAALADYRPEDTHAVAAIRAKRDAGPLKFTIERVGNSRNAVVDSARVREQLDKIVDAAKGMNVTEIEIKAYFPMVKEGARPRARAVKDYFVMKGVDESVITLSLRGPGYGNKDMGLARAAAVVVEISGSPKQNTQPQEGSSPAKRSAEFLLA